MEIGSEPQSSTVAKNVIRFFHLVVFPGTTENMFFFLLPLP